MAVVKAESAVAYLAKKVHVLVLIAVLILAPTKLITGSAVAILHGMHHVTLTKEGQRPKNIRLVDGLYLYLKVAHRQRMAPGGQRLHDEYAVGRGPHAVALDRKSTRLNSSHANISYAVFCL